MTNAEARDCVSGGRGTLRALLLGGLLPLLLGGCGSPGCADEVVQHEPSPYGRGTAIVFVRHCGATTDLSTQVSIIGYGDTSTRDRSVVFVAERGDAPAGLGGGPVVRARWVDANQVEIAHDARVSTHRRAAAHGTLRITYVPLP